MQSFDATLKFDPHFMCLCLNHFGGLSMKMSWAYTGMLSSEIDDFKFLTTVKNIKSICITCTIAPGLMELFYLSKPVRR